MKKQYDFSKGKRGKFYHPDAVFNLPIYLEAEMAQFIKGIAENRDSDMNTVVNSLLRKNKELMDSMKNSNNVKV